MRRHTSNVFGKVCPLRRERGAVLVIALIMLLLLTMLGVSGMRNSTMEERMAGNLKEQYRALQVAEEALRLAEAEIDSGAPNALSQPDVNCADSIIDTLGAGNFVAVAANTLSPDEVVPQRHFRYCGPRVREYRNDVGLAPTADSGGQAKIVVEYFTVMGVGRIADNADAALVSTYGR